MIRIRPEDLCFAIALGTIRRRPRPSTGPANALRYHQLSYRGGPTLRFSTTDFRVSLVSELPVDGQGDAWECRVPVENFEAVAAMAEGGSMTLDPSPLRHVLVSRWSRAQDDQLQRSFQAAYLFFRVSDPAAYPCPALIPDSEPALVNSTDLRHALSFVAPATTNDSPDAKLDTCTITPAGAAITYSNRVFFLAAIKPLPFDVNVLCSDAARLRTWLSALGSRRPAQVAVSRGRDQEQRLWYEIATPDGAHTFRVVAVRRPVPTEFVAEVLGEAPAFRGTVKWGPLREIAGFCSQFRGAPLECRVLVAADGVSLRAVSTADNVPAGGPVPLDDFQCDDPQTETSFFISPRELLTALDRHRRRRLRFSYRPRSRTVELSDGEEASGVGAQGNTSIVRIAPGPRPSGGGPIPVEHECTDTARPAADRVADGC